MICCYFVGNENKEEHLRINLINMDYGCLLVPKYCMTNCYTCTYFRWRTAILVTLCVSEIRERLESPWATWSMYVIMNMMYRCDSLEDETMTEGTAFLPDKIHHCLTFDTTLYKSCNWKYHRCHWHGKEKLWAARTSLWHS